MDRSAVRLTDRSAAYQKSGWQSFHPNGKPFDVEQVRSEREMYR